MIRIYLSPPTEAAVDFFNDRPQDPLMGKMIRHKEMESQWLKILNYIKNDENSAIDSAGYDDVFLCLMYLLKTKKVEIPLGAFELINGDLKTHFYWIDEDEIEIHDFGFFGRNLRADWLF